MEALHQLGRIAMLLILVVLLGLGALGLRLSAGPLEIPNLASWLATEGSGRGIRIELKTAELAWAGYHQGGGVPLQLQLGNIVVRNAVGAVLATVPQASLAASPALLFDRRAPVEITASGARISGATVPVSLQASLRLDRQFNIAGAEMAAQLGAGQLGTGDISLMITDGVFRMDFTPGQVTLSGGALHLARVGESAPQIRFSGTGTRHHGWQGALRVTADAVTAADLPAYWPQGLLAATRRWVVRNIPAGTAQNADFTFQLTAPEDLAKIDLADATGHFDATGLTLDWITGVRRITELNGRFTVLDKDTALITANAARLGGLALSAGQFKITGMSQPDQTGQLSLAIDGSVPDVIAILAPPPLELLRQAPPQVAQATGQASGKITATLPFKVKLGIADVALNVDATLRDVRMASPAEGLDFTDGTGRLQATGHGLAVKADVRFAGEPATVNLAASFEGDDIGHFTLQSRAGPQMLHRLGLDAQTAYLDPVTGTVPFSLQVDGPGQGAQTAAVTADLTPAGLSAPTFGWRKAAGVPGQLTLSATLIDDQFAQLNHVAAQAPGLEIASERQGNALALTSVVLGRTRATGSITPPVANQGWVLALSGRELDVHVISTPAKPAPAKTAPSDAPPSGPAWQARLNFARLDLAADPAPPLGNFIFSGSGIGGTLTQANASADGLTLSVTPAGPARRALRMQSLDFGMLLRAIGAYDDLEDGKLELDMQYGGAMPAEGVGKLQKFRILNAPKFAKVLQGISIYGAANAATSQGLSFDRAVVPFREDGRNFTLIGARAFSTSIGFTASGNIALANGATDIDATIVPLYAFNSALGKIPILGHLFTAEKGGGLLAVRAKITGTLSDPKASVNPLSALTPGVLRDIFGLGELPHATAGTAGK